MQPNLQALSTPAAAGSAQNGVGAAADPWDAPYFGAPVYFAYRASTATDAHATATGPALDTLHPPHFGAPVYLAYEPGIPGFAREPATPGPAAYGAAAPLPPASQPQTPAGEGQATRRRGWLARLLGRRG